MEHFPPGFRFYPTEEELISFYLHNKLDSQKPEVDRVIPSIDIYFFEPSQLPEKASKLFDKDSEQWFFFMPQQEREARGGRPNRTTATGYWKATGSPSYVYSSSNKVIGVKKTMVFYEGKAPNGRKTQWKMNEYKAIKQVDNNLNANVSPSTSTIPKLRHEISVCRVYVTSGCARAFDRRPPGTTCTTTTTTLNDNSASHNDNIISTTFDHNIIQVEVGQGSGTTHQHAETSMNVPNTILLEEKSSSVDDSSNSGGDDTCTHQTTSTMEACINNHDFEMTESLDSLIDWDPSNLLGYNFDY